MENHEECEEIVEQTYEECADMMNEMHHRIHPTNHTRRHDEDTRSHESHDRHGCH